MDGDALEAARSGGSGSHEAAGVTAAEMKTEIFKVLMHCLITAI